MPEQHPRPCPPRPAHGAAALAACALATVLGATALAGGGPLRAAFGIAACGSGDGDSPERPLEVQAEVGTLQLPEPALAVGAVRLGTAASHQAAPPLGLAPGAFPQLPAQAGQAEHELARSEDACRRMDWEGAQRHAQACLALNPQGEAAVRARRIQEHAPRLAELFAGLATPDALVRNYDTSPGLVSIATATGTLLAVALSGGDARHPQLIEADAVAAITRALSAGPVQALVKGASGFVLTTLPADSAEVRLVDQGRLHDRLEQELGRRIERLRQGADAGDALAWYAAGAEAYQNRLDDRVTALLDQALDLDPQLLRSVREDAAGRLSAAMVLALHRGSRPQAAAFLGLIRQRYPDTDQGRRALLLFDGRTQELLALDGKLQAQPHSADPALPQPAARPALPLPGGTLADARQELDAGLPSYQQAMLMGPVAGRNDVYRSALGHFLAAQRILAALARRDPENAELHALLVEANLDCFGCRKGLSDE